MISVGSGFNVLLHRAAYWKCKVAFIYLKVLKNLEVCPLETIWRDFYMVRNSLLQMQERIMNNHRQLCNASEDTTQCVKLNYSAYTTGI